MNSLPNYDFLDNSISKPVKAKPAKKSPTKPKAVKAVKPVKPAKAVKPKPVKASKMNMSQAPPNMKQAKPKPPVKSKPKVIAVINKKKPTPQDKPVSNPVMTKTNVEKLKQSTNKNKFDKAQAQSNSEKIDSSNTGLFGEIQANQEESGVPLMSISKYSTIINQMKKIVNTSGLLLENGDMVEVLLKNQQKIMNSINEKYKVNTQRAILSNIITLLTYSDNDTPARVIKAFELRRKQIQMKPTATPTPKSPKPQAPVKPAPAQSTY